MALSGQAALGALAGLEAHDGGEKDDREEELGAPAESSSPKSSGSVAPVDNSGPLSNLRDPRARRPSITMKMGDEGLPHGASGPEDEGLDPLAIHAMESLQNRPRASHPSIGLCTNKATELMNVAQEAADGAMLNRDCMKEVIAENHARSAGCFALPFTISIFFFYSLSARLHEDTTNVYLIESAFRSELLPWLSEISSTLKVYDFLEKKYVPFFFRQTDIYGDALPSSEWGRVMFYNKVQGSVMLEQWRSIGQPCGLAATSHLTCYPTDQPDRSSFGRDRRVGVENHSRPFVVDRYYPSVIDDRDEGFDLARRQRRLEGHRRLGMLQPEMQTYCCEFPDAEDDAFRFFLHPQDLVNKTLRRVGYLKDRGWIDEQTQQLRISALVLNAELGRPRLERVVLDIWFARTGNMQIKLGLFVVFLKGWSDMNSVGVDVLFGLQLIGWTVVEFVALFKAVRRGEMAEYRSWSTLLAWSIVIVGWAYIAMMGLQHILRESLILKLDKVLMDQENNATLVEQELASEALHKEADSMATFQGWNNMLIAYSHLFLIVRSFVALKYQPRLAMVTATLQACANDLGNFLLVFSPTFAAFAIAAFFIFGRRLEEFSTIAGALATCFKISMESEFDWQRLSEEDWRMAILWVMLYLVMVVLLMLNMVLAIIMDVYTEVRERQGHTETVWENIKFLCVRLRRARSWVPDPELLMHLQDMPKNFNVHDFHDEFPNMSIPQLNRLTALCRQKAAESAKSLLQSADLSHITSAIKIGLDEVMDELDLHQAEVDDRKTKRGNDLLISQAYTEDIIRSIATQGTWMHRVEEQIHQIRQKTQDLARSTSGGLAMDDGDERYTQGAIGSAMGRGPLPIL